MATPLVVVLLPVVMGERFEGILAGILVGLASLSAGLSLLRGDRRPLGPYALALAALLLRDHLARAEADPVDVLLVAVATGGFVVTHVASLRRARCEA